jgi:hypothetical protein
MVSVSDAPPEAGRDSRITRFRWWATGKGDRAIARSAPSIEDGDPRQAATLPVDPGAPQLGVVRLLGADPHPAVATVARRAVRFLHMAQCRQRRPRARKEWAIVR